MVIDGFMEENGLQATPSPCACLPKRKLRRPIQKTPRPPKKRLVGRGRVYTMENKDTYADYQNVVRLGDQK